MEAGEIEPAGEGEGEGRDCVDSRQPAGPPPVASRALERTRTRERGLEWKARLAQEESRGKVQVLEALYLLDIVLKKTSSLPLG